MRTSWRTLVLALLATGSLMQPVQALVKMDKEAVEQALLYGLQQKGQGYVRLLGSNWIEGPNGTLLNVYTPFMMLASKAYSSDFPSSPSKEDMKKVKEKFGKEVAYYRDPKNKPLVKFAVSFYGNSPDFATKYTARIEGFGRGKTFDLKPKKQHQDKIADPVNVGGQTMYEAINSYYFAFNSLENLDEYRLILTSEAGGDPLVFRLRNARLN